MTMPPPPPGQPPLDPRAAFSPPPPPPTYIMPPIAPPRRRTSVIATALATALVLLSIVGNIFLFIWLSAAASGDSFHEDVLVKGDSNKTVAVVPLTGLIDDATARQFQKTMQKLSENDDVKALVLEVNTPGGTVAASDEIYARLMRFKSERHVPIVVAMGGMATSGGYYISCAADKIVAEKTTITANIGVLMERFDVSELAQKYGVYDDSMHSTGSTFKTTGSWLKKLTPDEQAYLQDLIDDAFNSFKSVVQTSRQGKLTAGMDVIANGKAYTSTEAIKFGLVDQFGYLNDAYDLAAKMAGLSGQKVIRFEPENSLLGGMGAKSNLPAVVSFGGADFKVSRGFLDELTSPRLMYLWRE